MKDEGTLGGRTTKNNKIVMAGTILAVALVALGCTAKLTTSPAATNSNAASPSAAASPAKKTEPPKPTTELKSDKKPEGGTAKAVTTAKKVPVPADWIYVYDSVKQYGFYVPEGSKGENDTVEGVTYFLANTPAPAEVEIIVLAYRDKTLTKEDLLNDAVRFLEEWDEKVQVGSLMDAGDDYGLADATSVDAQGKKSKYRILVGTDVRDNYVMILGTDESKFEANKDVIDAIWGSFEMW